MEMLARIRLTAPAVGEWLDKNVISALLSSSPLPQGEVEIAERFRVRELRGVQGIALRAPSSGPSGHSRIGVRDRLLPEGEGKGGAWTVAEVQYSSPLKMTGRHPQLFIGPQLRSKI